MTYARRVDTNQQEIASALRKAGATVWSLHKNGEGCPDLLVGLRGRNYLFEVKRPDLPPSKQLTEEQEKWHRMWRGQVAVVESVEQALRILAQLASLART